MKYNYCTIFDKSFLNRGLSLYNSLIEHHKKDFRLFMLCLDDTSYQIITKLNLKNAHPVCLEDFEDEKILESKKTRTFREYCWSLSSMFTNYILSLHPEMEMISYLDADLFFFDSPEKIVNPFFENKDYSILIIPHNLPESKKSKEVAVGKYNVGMLSFKNNEIGRACLAWWSEKCLEWCYDIVEPTRYGDQKYLDYFEEKFDGVYIERSKGAGLAPWNIKNYIGKIYKKDNSIYVDGDALIFFHFSSFKILYPQSKFMPNAPLDGTYDYIQPSIEKKLIYRKYFEAIYSAMVQIRKGDKSFNFGVIERPSLYRQVKDIILPSLLSRARKILLKALPTQILRPAQKIKSLLK